MPTDLHQAMPPNQHADTEVPISNRLGLMSLWFGIAGLVILGFISGIPGIIMGHKALSAAREGSAGNQTVARLGLVLSWLATILSIGLLVWILASRADG